MNSYKKPPYIWGLFNNQFFLKKFITIRFNDIYYKQKTPSFLKGFNVAPGGIEPPTQGFSVLCSTD